MPSVVVTVVLCESGQVGTTRFPVESSISNLMHVTFSLNPDKRGGAMQHGRHTFREGVTRIYLQRFLAMRGFAPVSQPFVVYRNSSSRRAPRNGRMYGFYFAKTLQPWSVVLPPLIRTSCIVA